MSGPSKETASEAKPTAPPGAAPKVELVYQLTPQRERSALLRNPLLDLLQAVRQQGSISGAARQLGQSYRHVWGQLKEWEQTVGHDLIIWDRGQAARLTPFADKLLWAERLAQARLAPQIEALRAELERALATVFDVRTQVLSLHASHDDALARLQDLAPAEAGLHLDIQFTGSVDAIRALNEGRCQLAGFHTRQQPGARTLTARTYKPLLKPGRHKLIGFALRSMGLVVAPDNPLQLASLSDVAATQARWVNRPLGTGTRVLLDEMLADAALGQGDLRGYGNSQPSHAAVAQAVANGLADAGLVNESAARSAGLGFVPLAQERYQLVCLKSELDSPAVQALRQLLASPCWNHTLLTLPGYANDEGGTVKPMNRCLPWWAFKS
jgi:putative molybdopterin biosynthesis protein